MSPRGSAGTASRSAEPRAGAASSGGAVRGGAARRGITPAGRCIAAPAPHPVPGKLAGGAAWDSASQPAVSWVEGERRSGWRFVRSYSARSRRDTTRIGVKAPRLQSFCRPHSREVFQRVFPVARRALRAYVALISKAKTKVDSFIWNWGYSKCRWQLGLWESNGHPGTRSSSAGGGGTAIGSDALSRFPLLLSAGRAAAGQCLFQLTLGFAF